MKKQILALAAAILAVSFAQAQFALRPYVGINSHNLTEDFDDAEWKSKIGYQLGVDFQIGNKFYVQPGVQLEFARNSIGIDTLAGEIKFERTHLRVPVMVGYSFGEVDGDFAARIFTGPNAVIVFSTSSDDGFFNITKDDLKKAVFGWNVGVGLDISIIFIDAGYQFGLSEVFENFDNGSRDNFFYANAGVRIRF